tara:strand:+ start:921 stop:1091 length:171 start_codon:yes stop_codon:yes gene_type:complete
MKVRVETVELTKKVYFVEIEDGSPAVWACDDVVCKDVEPFSVEVMDETIFGYIECE